MTCTSDERREVAERLRKASEFPEENILAALVDICGINFNFSGNVTLWRSTMTRLADLIDPTCAIVSTDCACSCRTYRLSCGHSVSRPLRSNTPEYCSVCGARVVNE